MISTSSSQPKYTIWNRLLYGLKATTILIGWVVGPAVFLLGLVANDAPGSSIVLLDGFLIWWLATGINYSLRKERIAVEPPEDEY